MNSSWHADFAATPPFHHIAANAALLAGDDWPDLSILNALAAAQGLRNNAGLPLTFAAQHVHCGQWDYEAAILAGGAVPSRERNWHDLLNALTWLAFPRAKAALNALQCEQLERHRGSPRGPLSDAGTLFDESGLLLVGTDDELAQLLAARRWQDAFVARRGEWQHLRAYAFGHAVLEKLLAPWPGITTKCLFLPVATLPETGVPPAWLDVQLADTWRAGVIERPSDLFPVPVLGLPGWWPGNADAAFYQDVGVFRPVRMM
jgi:hypothetical protein